MPITVMHTKLISYPRRITLLMRGRDDYFKSVYRGMMDAWLLIAKNIRGKPTMMPVTSVYRGMLFDYRYEMESTSALDPMLTPVKPRIR